MKKLHILNCILTVAIGVLMLFAPESFIKVAVVLIGIRSIAAGFHGLFCVCKMLSFPQFKRMVVLRGILCIVCGAFFAAFPLFAAKVAWTVFIYAVAIYLSAVSLLQIYACIKLRANSVEIGGFVGEIALSLLIAAAFFVVPLQSGIALLRICGAALSLGGVAFAIFQAKN